MLPGRWFYASAFLLFAPWCVAEESAPVDFSQGFKQLAALGLPPLPSGTKWSVLPESMTENQRENGQLPKGMKGNAWLLPPTAEGKRQVVLFGTLTATELQSDAEKPAESTGAIGKLLGGGPKKEPAPVEADLAKDVKSLLPELEKQAKKNSLSDYDSYDGRQNGMAPGPLLLFATQIYQTGDTRLANDLASALLQTTPDRESVVDGAINHLGQQQYKSAADAFFQTKDWKAYHKEVVALVARFPRGWNDREAAALLVDPLSKRASGASPPPLKLDGVELDPRAVESIHWMVEEPSAQKSGPSIPPEIARQLAGIPARYRAEYLRQMSMEDGGSLGRAGTWLLVKKPATPEEKPEEKSEEKPDITQPTLQLGTAALPVLAALIDDPYLTIHPNPEASGYSYHDSDDSPADRILKSYHDMNRPASRGDLAKNLLASTLPDPDGEISSADAQTIRDLTLDFWKQHRDDSPDDLALAFLREGSSEQKSEAAEILTTSGNPEVLKALETHMLEDPSPASQITIAQSYVKTRKSAAKPFLDLYVKALRQELGPGTDWDEIRGLPYDIRNAKNIEPFIKQLESQVSGKSPQARAREIAKEDPKAATASIAAFAQSLSDAPPRRLLLALLAGAVAAEDPVIRGTFISYTMRSSYGPDEEDGGDGKKTNTIRTVPPGETKAWQTLLADVRELPEAVSRRSTGSGKTLGDYAAIAFESSVDSELREKLVPAAAVTGKSYAEIVIPRGRARLAGEPLPPLPDASKVPPRRLKEIVATAATKQPLEIHPYLKTLTDDERAAWLAWYEEPGELAIPDGVRQPALTVIGRDAEQYNHKDMPGVMGVDVGFQINKESLEKHLQHLAGDVSRNSRCFMNISPSPFPPGLEAFAFKMDLPEKKAKPADGDENDTSKQEEMSESYNSPKSVFSACIQLFQFTGVPENATGVIYGTISSDRGSGAATVWWIIDGKAVPVKPENDHPDLLTALAQKEAEKTAVSLNLQILSRADADALKESE